MTPDKYLERVLENQKLTSAELDELRRHRADVQEILEDHFNDSDPNIQYAGSYKKQTMIHDSYDLDVVCYFANGDDDAGDSLRDIYDSASQALSEDYHVERKTSALRIMEKGALVSRTDFRIDVVPGRFTDDSESDSFLHQEGGEKVRLKTNLRTHVEHIRDSGVRGAIKLLKLWKYQRQVRIKTFILELLVVDLLKHRKNAKLSTQLIHVLTEFRDNAEDLTVVDPANANNDLSPLLEAARGDLSAWASTTLDHIETDEWDSVFGKLQEDKKSEQGLATAIGTVAATGPSNRPWLPRA